jgi:hypothetical protein
MLISEIKKGSPVVILDTFKGEGGDVIVPAIGVINSSDCKYDTKQGAMAELMGGRLISINDLYTISPSSLGTAKAWGLNLTAALDNADRLNLSELNKFQIKWCIDHQ